MLCVSPWDAVHPHPPHLPCTLQQGPCARPTGDSPSMHVHPSSSVCRLALARACLLALPACAPPIRAKRTCVYGACRQVRRLVDERRNPHKLWTPCSWPGRAISAAGVGRGEAMCHGERHHERAGGGEASLWLVVVVVAAPLTMGDGMLAGFRQPRGCRALAAAATVRERVQSPEPRAQSPRGIESQCPACRPALRLARAALRSGLRLCTVQ